MIVVAGLLCLYLLWVEYRLVRLIGFFREITSINVELEMKKLTEQLTKEKKGKK